MKKPVNLILGTMTFGESVFMPDVGEFINAFLDAKGTNVSDISPVSSLIFNMTKPCSPVSSKPLGSRHPG